MASLPSSVPEDLYRPLNADRREIRIVTLEPGAWNTEISCSLAVVSLDERPAYEALSYVWGDQKSLVPIHLNGHIFPVTLNLRNALRRMRGTQPRVLWVDAISVNQTSPSERAQQVGIMAEIYQSTSECQIYLGESRLLELICEEETALWDPPPRVVFSEGDGEALSQNIMAFFRQQDRHMDDSSFACGLKLLGTQENAILKRHRSRLGSRSGVQLVRQADAGALAIISLLANMRCIGACNHITFDNALWAESLISLAHMLERPWWSRVWTFQESLLPDKATITYGEVTCDLNLVERAGSLIPMHLSRCCGTTFEQLPAEQRRVLFRLERLMTFQEHARHDYVTYTDDAAPRLLEHLQCTRMREATDPRDKVFGLLGMVKHLPNPLSLTADYSMTLEQVYAQTTMEIIRQSNSLQVLVTNEIKRPGSRMPTWCVDWTVRDNEVESDHWARERTRRFEAYPARSKDEPVAELCGDLALAVRGYQVGVVGVSTSPASQAFNMTEIIRQRDLLTRLELGAPDHDTLGWIADPSFLQTMLAGVALHENHVHHRPTTDNDTSFLFCWWLRESGRMPQLLSQMGPQKAEDMEAFAASIKRIERSFWGANDGRSFFVTSDKRIGLGPADVRAGDVVYLLEGGKVPFILRATDHLRGGSADTKERLKSFHFVGHCYINGFMNGEATLNGTFAAERVILV